MSAEDHTSGAFPLKVFLDIRFDGKRLQMAYSLVQGLYHGILCFLHVIRFNGTRLNITPFTPTRKVIYFLRQFSRNT